VARSSQSGVPRGAALHLIVIQPLPRPGSAVDPDICHRLFFESPKVTALKWPVEAVEQFLFDHGSKPEFLEQYGHLNLRALTCDRESLGAQELVGASIYPAFQDWVSSVETNVGYFIQIDNRNAEWEENGTWRTPPVVMDATLLQVPHAGLHIVEGNQCNAPRPGALRPPNIEPEE
jgi:hypothetical protein